MHERVYVCACHFKHRLTLVLERLNQEACWQPKLEPHTWADRCSSIELRKLPAPKFVCPLSSLDSFCNIISQGLPFLYIFVYFKQRRRSCSFSYVPRKQLISKKRTEVWEPEKQVCNLYFTASESTSKLTGLPRQLWLAISISWI